MSNSTTPLLEVRNIEAGYGASQVLFGVSLTIEPHQVVSLMGRNGMGKSTTIKCITGALPVRKGQIFFEGQEITNLPADEIARRGIALVPEGRMCFPNLTVREHLVAFARPPAKSLKGEQGALVEPWDLDKIYELFPRLKEREHNMGNQLSGGEQQMLAIGRALSTNPKLLILDEATEGLAPVVREEIWKCLKLLKTSGLATLVVDKYINKIIETTNTNFVLEQGHITWSGTSNDLRSNVGKLFNQIAIDNSNIMKKTHQVFGMSNEILPESYVDRGALDSFLKVYLDRSEHIALKGPSKSGKTWLRKRVISNSLVVQCRLGTSNIDIYTQALAQLGISFVLEKKSTGEVQCKIEASAELGNDLIAKAKVQMGLNGKLSEETLMSPVGMDISNLNFIASIIKSSGKRLVVEDVHYLSPEQKNIFAYDLKALWDLGCFVIVVGVWGQSNMFVSIVGNLAGRIREIPVEWSSDDLNKIIDKGSQALNLSISPSIRNRIIEDSFGSAGLLQRLVLQTLDESRFFESKKTLTEISDDGVYSSAAMFVADQLNGLYQKFGLRVASGIRKRNDSTGIYSYAMDAIINSSDEEMKNGISIDDIFNHSSSRQSKIKKQNLESILTKIDSLQIDENGEGLVITYDHDKKIVIAVDRQLLFYRKYLTLSWAWENIIKEIESQNNE